MDQLALRDFTERYLQTNDCKILESTPSYLHTQLSMEADKDLVNRPFYWSYVEKMNLEPNPVQLCFVFDPDHPPEGIRAEHLFYGSPRCQQLLQSAQKQGKFVRLYQQHKGWSTASKAYIPWLSLHYLVSYVCDQKKDQLISLGISLQSGEIQNDFYTQLKQHDWTAKLPDQRYTISPRLTIAEAVGELEYALEEQINAEDHQWAEAAQQRLADELAQVATFFPDKEKRSDEQQAAYEARKRECIWQYHPRVEVNLVAAGLFYIEQ